MDKTIIKDLVVRGIIGIEDWEREKLQEILINIVLYSDQSAAAESDDIANCVNYKTVTKKVIAHTEGAKRFTVEALAADIAEISLEAPHVQKVRVRVEKPGAVRFSKSVGVEIERSKNA
ncbi:MAG: dihydroneopterin aldolase [Chloroflexi bacterium]|nr:dihydroneopterin aldolase [Chloroflexota bacterium]